MSTAAAQGQQNNASGGDPASQQGQQAAQAAQGQQAAQGEQNTQGQQAQQGQQEAQGQQAAQSQQTAPNAFQELISQINDPKLKEYGQRYTSAEDLVRTALNLRDDVSKRIKVPDENASEEDKQKYRKALGIPEAADGYKEAIQLPQGVQLTESDNVILDAVLPIAHEAGVPAGAMGKLVSKFVELSHNLQNEAAQTIVNFGKQAEADLKREWGKDYDANVEIGRRFRDQFGGPELQAFFNETQLATGGLVGDHPVIVKLMASLGRKSGEGELLLGATPQERQSIQDQINKLNNDVPPGSAGYTNPEHQKKLQTLYSQLHGKQPIVGAGNRSF